MIVDLASVPTAFVIGLGGAAGALARYAVGRGLDGGRRSTFAVNVLGSTLLGALVASAPSDVAFAAAGTGFCGAFTTFSSFVVIVAQTAADGRPDVALINAAGTLSAALVGVGVGWTLVGIL